MNLTIARCAFIVAFATVVILAVIAPWTLSDQNTFLKGFINHELLAVIGVIVTITLASAANLHLQLNIIEERVGQRVFSSTKGAVRRSAYSLIWMLLLALVLVVVKPMVLRHQVSEIAAAVVNGIGV